MAEPARAIQQAWLSSFHLNALHMGIAYLGNIVALIVLLYNI